MSKEESLRRIADAVKALINEVIDFRTHHGGCVCADCGFGGMKFEAKSFQKVL